MDNMTDEQKKLHLMKAQAVRQALIEVLSENRVEIMKRAAAKLTAMGIEVQASEIDAQI